MAEVKSLRNQLSEIAGELNLKYGMKVFFCEIFGSRWSFLTGDKTLDVPEHRIKLNDDYGMMTGEISCSEEEWLQIIKRIKALF